MPIYRTGDGYSDRNRNPGGGEDITELIDRLTPKKRGKGRLPDPPTREGLPVSRAESLPATPLNSVGGGIDWPLTETGPAAGATVYTLYSSDGLFSLQFDSATAYTDNSGGGGDVNHLDPNA